MMKYIMIGKDYEWYKVANNISELGLNNEGLIDVMVNNKQICLAYFKNNLFSFSAVCPHAGGKLSCGYLDNEGNIVCPLHGYKFNLQNGRNVTGEGYNLKIFPVKILANAVFVGIEKNKLEI